MLMGMKCTLMPDFIGVLCSFITTWGLELFDLTVMHNSYSRYRRSG